MGYREEWKMIHLLNTSKKGKLDASELNAMGVTCNSDTVMPLLDRNIVEYDDKFNGPYWLNPIANAVINEFIVCNGNRVKTIMQVDQPVCFVIMPFSETWSENIYKNLIEPAIIDAGLKCIRGDEIERTGQLNSNIFKTLQEVGLVIAEISSPNPNVYYEIGVVDTLGKEILFLYDPDKNNKIPADKLEIHYTEYSQDNLPDAKEKLTAELKKISEKYKMLATPDFCRI